MLVLALQFSRGQSDLGNLNLSGDLDHVDHRGALGAHT